MSSSQPITALGCHLVRQLASAQLPTHWTGANELFLGLSPETREIFFFVTHSLALAGVVHVLMRCVLCFLLDGWQARWMDGR